MAETLDPVTQTSTESPKGGAIKATRGRPPAEFYMQEYGQKQGLSVSDSYFQHRCHILENELNDAERKARNLVDELLQVKRELSEDRTGMLLKHQEELSKLREEHRNEIDEKKDAFLKVVQELQKHIDSLEKDMFKKDLEHKNGERSAGNRLLDMAEDSAPQLFETLTGFLAALQNQPQTNFTPPYAPVQNRQIEEKLNTSDVDQRSGASAPGHSLPNEGDEQLSELLEKELNNNSAEEEV